MKTLIAATIGFLMFASLTVAQTVTWQALPFPTDSNWPGPQGLPAVISDGDILLQGQPARTDQFFTGRRKFVLDVSVEERFADDGSFDLSFIPLGQATDKNLTVVTKFRMIYRNFGADALTVGDQNGLLWGEAPFNVVAGKNYHIVARVSAAGRLTIKINRKLLPVPPTVVVPSAEFQIQIGGWQPTNRWHVRNFAAS